MQAELKYCRNITETDCIFYDSVKNQFLVNGITVLEVRPNIEFKIINVVEQADNAGLSQSEILSIVAKIIWDSYPKMHK